MSQVGTRSEVNLPVRWVVLFTGSKATEDYQPTASAEESPALIREVSEMCVAFHPHTDIRHFPQDGDAILFWRANATQDWVVTRVTVAPNPQGLRTALEYASVVFTDAEFAKIGRNPFHARDLHLHEKVRQAYMAEGREALEFDLTGTTVVVRPPVAEVNGAERRSPSLSPGALSTVENYRALQEYCARAEEQGRTPQTFATWWSSHSQPPAGYFEMVLKAAPPKPMSLREAITELKKINGDTKDALPSSPSDDTVAGELSRSILTKSDLLVSSVDSIAARSNVDSVAVYQASMGEAASQAGQIYRDVERFRDRLNGKADPVTLDRLTALGARYHILSNELSKVPHPDPFRPVDPVVAKSTNIGPTPKVKTHDEPRGGGPNPALIGVGVLAVGAIGAFLVFGKGNNPNVKPSTPPSAQASANGGSKATPKAVPTDPVAKLLATHEAEAIPFARSAAEAAGQAEGLKGNKPEQSEVRRMALRAIRDGYRKALNDRDYDVAFGSAGWDFGKFEKELPKLATEAKTGVELGVIKGESARKDKQSQAEKDRLAADAAAKAEALRKAQEAANRPTPEPTSRPVRRSDPDEDRPKPKPKPKPKPPSGGGSKPKPSGGGGGTVGNTDL